MDKEFQIDEWLVQPSRNRIQGPGRASTIKLKSMEVLVVLAEAGGAVVRKQVLMEAVWGNAEVTEDVLTQCIVELRKAFGDSASEPTVIETIRRVGFRLIPPVRHVQAGASGVRRRSIAPTTLAVVLFAVSVVFAVYQLSKREPEATPVASDPSIAVLPFANLSDDPDNQYFGDGLAEELLDRLTKVPGLRVPARTSSFAFRDRAMPVGAIGRHLGVNHVLEGSIRKSAGQIRITVQLIDVERDVHLWSKVFEREAGEVFAIQDDIAETVVSALVPTMELTAQPPAVTKSQDIEAYDLYLLGRHHLRHARVVRAREFFERAILRDAEYALAYAGLAESVLGFRDTPGSFWQAQEDDDRLDVAESAIATALDLDPRLAEAYMARAALHVSKRDIAAEEVDLRKALELNPYLADARARLGSNLLSQGRLDDALQAYTQAIRLDPLNPDINVALSRLVSQTDGYDAALTHPLRLLESELTSPQIYQVLMANASDHGRYVERIKWGLRLVALLPEQGAALAELADAYMELGEFELAQIWARHATEKSPAQALKANMRLLYATGDTAGGEQLIREAFERNAPGAGEPLSPAQAAIIPLFAITRLHAGDYQLAAQLFERIMKNSAALPRRPVHFGLYARAMLAACYQGLGETAKLEDLVKQSLEAAARARRQGVDDFPLLTRELAKAYALKGDREMALEYQAAAVAQGWRQYYLETIRPTDPVGRLLEQDARYQETMKRLKASLAEMRRAVRQNGWDLTPEQFFSGN